MTSFSHFMLTSALKCETRVLLFSKGPLIKVLVRSCLLVDRILQ